MNLALQKQVWTATSISDVSLENSSIRYGSSYWYSRWTAASQHLPPGDKPLWRPAIVVDPTSTHDLLVTILTAIGSQQGYLMDADASILNCPFAIGEEQRPLFPDANNTRRRLRPAARVRAAQIESHLKSFSAIFGFGWVRRLGT